MITDTLPALILLLLPTLIRVGMPALVRHWPAIESYLHIFLTAMPDILGAARKALLESQGEDICDCPVPGTVDDLAERLYLTHAKSVGKPYGTWVSLPNPIRGHWLSVAIESRR